MALILTQTTCPESSIEKGTETELLHCDWSYFNDAVDLQQTAQSELERLNH